MTVFELVGKGGWIMVSIALCSIVGAWIYIERVLAYRLLKSDAGRLVDLIKPMIMADNADQAREKLASLDDAASRVLRTGLSVYDKGRQATREAIEGEANYLVYQIEERTSVLATVAGVAPLLGFLGTVLGMIKAFQQIEGLGGNVNATVLAGGIWEAMVTTAAGLAVGIPAIIAYNHLQSMMRSIIASMEKAGDELLNLMA
jgi:biopolymer transport protein ExbB